MKHTPETERIAKAGMRFAEHQQASAKAARKAFKKAIGDLPAEDNPEWVAKATEQIRAMSPGEVNSFLLLMLTNRPEDEVNLLTLFCARCDELLDQRVKDSPSLPVVWTMLECLKAELRRRDPKPRNSDRDATIVKLKGEGKSYGKIALALKMDRAAVIAAYQRATGKKKK